MKIHGNNFKIRLPLMILAIFVMFTQNLPSDTDNDFDFNLTVNKTKVYVGESLRVTFLFKHKVSLDITEANFAPPTFNGFWVKSDKNVPNTIKNGYNIYTLKYLLTAQKAGVLKIEPARMDIGIAKKNQKSTLRFQRVKYKSIFSNPLEVEVERLPEDINLFGDYNISMTVDKTRISANEPVNVTLKIQGSGNIDEVEEFNIKNKDATVFSDEPKRVNKFKNGKNRGKMIQKFAFISDRNFTIEPFLIKFFDSKTKKIKKIKTKPVKITVINKDEDIVSQQTNSEYFNKSCSKIVFFLIITGSVLSLFGIIFYYIRKIKNNSNSSVQNRIKKSKNLKSLLQLLLPYRGKTKKIDTIINKIEENIYETKNHKINKKELARNFNKYITRIDKW